MLYETALRRLAEVLSVNDRLPARVDFILLAAGEDALTEALATHRTQPGCQFLLFPHHRNRLIDLEVVPRCDRRLQQLLEKADIARSQIVVLPRPAANDWDLAEQLTELLQARRGTSAIILCDQFSGRRWRNIVCEIVPADFAHRVHVRSVASADIHSYDWWRSKAGIQRIFHGYLGLLFTVIHGRESVPVDESSAAAYEAAVLNRLQYTHKFQDCDCQQRRGQNRMTRRR